MLILKVQDFQGFILFLACRLYQNVHLCPILAQVFEDNSHKRIMRTNSTRN